MRQRGRITAMAMLAAFALPGTAAAQDAFIRIEAKRGAAAEAAAEGWRERFPDVVTVPLANGMTGIVLGPQTPAQAAARMARLKAEGGIPADSYLTGPGGEAPLPGLAEALATVEVPGDADAGPRLDPSMPEAAAGEDADAPAGAEAIGANGPPPSGEAVVEGDDPVAAGETAADDRAAADATTGTEDAPATNDPAGAGLSSDPGATSAVAESAAAVRTAPGEVDPSAPDGDAQGAAGPAAAAGLTGAAPDRSPSIPSEAQDAPGEAAEAVATDTPPVTTSEAAPDTAPDTSPRHIQLQATPGRVSAEEALAEWRRSFPRAQLWRIPGGWYAVALPARPANEAGELLATLKAARRIPGDAFLATPVELGRMVEPQPGTAATQPPAPGTGVPAPETGAAGGTASGSEADAATVPPIMDDPATTTTATTAPEPAPPAPAVMPPVLEVQRALRWAGMYDGALDGQSGPGTRAAIDARIAATGGTATPAEAMAALIAEREAWRREMGLEPLHDAATGLTLLAPAAKLAFDRTERALSIYGPKEGSGAALILFAQPGGQQEMEDLAGLVTALGWVPHPERDINRGRFTLTGANDLHIGHAEGRVEDGMAEGWVLIWPAADAGNARRLAIEAGESFGRTAPAASVDEAAAPQ